MDRLTSAEKLFLCKAHNLIDARIRSMVADISCLPSAFFCTDNYRTHVPQGSYMSAKTYMNQEAVSATVLDVCSSQQLAVVKDLRVVLKDLYAEVLSQISETTHRRQNM